MSLPDLSDFCIQLFTGTGELCVQFPGGMKLCAQAGYELGDASEIVKSMLAQINSALTPLGPFFSLLDAVIAVKNCIMAIPDTIGPPPDPTALLNCLPGLLAAIDKLLQLLPQLSIPIMIKGILQVIITGLIGLRHKLAAMIRQTARVIQAALKAAQLGNIQLQLVADCASGNLDAQLVNLNAGMAPLNRLIGLINFLLELAGLPCIPTLGGIESLTDAALAPLDAAIALLQQLLALIPALDMILPPIPGPNDPC